jgi:hypothetical protein
MDEVRYAQIAMKRFRDSVHHKADTIPFHEPVPVGLEYVPPVVKVRAFTFVVDH